MAMEIRVASSPVDFARCFPVMNQLRDKLTLEQYSRRVALQSAEGYQIALVEADEQVVAVAGFRFFNMLSSGKMLYVDDLVTDEARRSQGFGEALIKWLIDLARKSDCQTFSLDSGVQRRRAHRFYFEQGMYVTDFHFQLNLLQ